MSTTRIAARIVVAVTVAVAPLIIGTPTHAEVFFRATAIADGMNTIVGGAAVPFGAVVEGATPAAQAVLDSLGNSHGYAANPYPGDFVVSVPGTVAGILPVPATVPRYPAFVTSDSGTQPEAHADYPAYTLASISGETGTHAAAAEGDRAADEGYAAADAQTRTTSDGTVHAIATSTVSGFQVPGVVSFGTVTTTAQVTRAPASRAQVKSRIQIWGVTVGGQSVGFSDGHFVAPGTEQPLPADPLADILSDAGVSVRYVDARRLPNGVVSPAVEVTVRQEAPAGNPASGKYTATYVLGRSTVTLDANGRAAGPTPAGLGSTGAAPSGPANEPAGSTTTSDAINANGQNIRSATESTNKLPVVAPGQPSAPTPARAALATSTPGYVETVDIYLAIVVAAAFLLVCSQFVRYLGSRYGWR